MITKKLILSFLASAIILSAVSTATFANTSNNSDSEITKSTIKTEPQGDSLPGEETQDEQDESDQNDVDFTTPPEADPEVEILPEIEVAPEVEIIPETDVIPDNPNPPESTEENGDETEVAPEPKPGVLPSEDDNIVDQKSFEEHVGDLIYNLSDKDLKTLRNLYSEILILEAAGQTDLLNAKWSEFNEIFSKYTQPQIDFDTFIGDLRNSLPNSILDSLRAIYDEILVLERNGDNDRVQIKWNEYNAILENQQKSLPDFNEFIQYTKSKLKKTDLNKLEKIYNKIISLEQNNSFEEAQHEWDLFYKTLNKYNTIETEPDPSIDLLTFDEFLGKYKSEISSSDLSKMKNLYLKAIAFEKQGDLSNSTATWNDFYEIFDKYVIVHPDFEVMINELKKDMSKFDLYKANYIYNKIISAEKQGDFNKSKIQWENLYKILSKYEVLSEPPQ